MSPEFPPVLRDIIASNDFPQGERNEAIRNLDDETKRVALEWLSRHSNVLAASPQIREIRQVLEGYTVFGIFRDVFENQLFAGWTQDPLASLKLWVGNPDEISANSLTAFFKKSESSDRLNGLSFLLDCYDCGIVTWDSIYSLLSMKYHDTTLLHNEEFFQMILTLPPDRLNSNQLCELLKIQGRYDQTPLHQKESLEMVLALPPGRLSSEQLYDLLKTQDRFGQTPLHQRASFEMVLALPPDRLNSDQLHELLKIKDGDNRTFLHSNLRAVLALPSERLNSEQLYELLKIADTYGNTPLHDGGNLQTLLALPLEKLNSDQLYELLKIQDRDGRTPLHNYQAALSLLPERLHPNQLYELLKIQDRDNRTPLHFEGTYKASLALLPEWLNFDRLHELLKIQDRFGKTPLHFEGTYKAVLSLSERLNFDQLHELLKIKDGDGLTPLCYGTNLLLILALPTDRLNSDQLYELLKIQDRSGKIPLHFEDNFQAVLPTLLKRLNFNQLHELLKIKDEDGRTLLHDNLQAVLTLPLEKLNSDQLYELLKIQDASGKTPLHFERNLQMVLALPPEILNPDQLDELLKIQDASGKTPLHFERNLQMVLALPPEILNLDQLCELLKVQDASGKTPLHIREIFSVILSFSQELLNKKELTELFSIQDDEGNTPLHYYPNLDRIQEISNELGLNILESILSVPSKRWLESPKTTVVQVHLNNQEYASRAEKLRDDVLLLWDELSFGEEEGQLSPIFLRSSLQNFTKDQVHIALESMLEKILSKLPWLGTPPEDNQQELHEFYTPILLNFEKIVQKLQEKTDPNETAGVLFDLAKTALEGRCAAAYQGEIEQSAAIILGEEANLSTDALLERGAKNTLVEVIEEIMRSLNSTDVHTYNQLAHVGGLLPAPDPLSHHSIAACRERLERKWVISRILPALSQAFKKIPTEQMIDWFKEKTDDAFGAKYLDLKAEAEAREEEILSSTKSTLLVKGMTQEHATSAVEFFRSSRGASLSIGQEALARTQKELKNALLGTIASKFSQFELSDAVLEEGLSHLEEGWQEVFGHIRRALAIPQALRLSWQNMATSFIASQLNAQNLYNEPFMQELSDAEQRDVLEEKMRFDERVKALAQEMSESEEADLSINLKEYGLPSKAIENSRRLAFAISFFKEEEERQQITGKGVLFAAKQIGVL